MKSTAAAFPHALFTIHSPILFVAASGPTCTSTSYGTAQTITLLATDTTLTLTDCTYTTLTINGAIPANFVTVMTRVTATTVTVLSITLTGSSASWLVQDSTISGTLDFSPASIAAQATVTFSGNTFNRLNVAGATKSNMNLIVSNNNCAATSYCFYVGSGHIVSNSVWTFNGNNFSTTGTAVYFHSTSSVVKTGSTISIGNGNFFRGATSSLSISINAGFLVMPGLTSSFEGPVSINYDASSANQQLYFGSANLFLGTVSIAVTGTLSDSSIELSGVRMPSGSLSITGGTSLTRTTISIVSSKLLGAATSITGSMVDGAVRVESSQFTSSVTLGVSLDRSNVTLWNSTFALAFTHTGPSIDASTVNVSSTKFTTTADFNNGFTTMSRLVVDGSNWTRLNLNGGMSTAASLVMRNSRALTAASYCVFASGGHFQTGATLLFEDNNFTTSASADCVYFHPTSSIFKATSTLTMRRTFVRVVAPTASTDSIILQADGGLLDFDGTNEIEGNVNIGLSLVPSGMRLHFANSSFMRMIHIAATGSVPDAYIRLDGIRSVGVAGDGMVISSSTTFVRSTILISNCQFHADLSITGTQLTQSSVISVMGTSVAGTLIAAINPVSNSSMWIADTTVVGATTLTTAFSWAYLTVLRSAFTGIFTVNGGTSTDSPWLIQSCTFYSRLAFSGTQHKNISLLVSDSSIITSGSYGVMTTVSTITSGTSHRYAGLAARMLAASGSSIYYATAGAFPVGTTFQLTRCFLNSTNYAVVVISSGGKMITDALTYFKGKIDMTCSASCASSSLYFVHSDITTFNVAVTGTGTDWVLGLYNSSVSGAFSLGATTNWLRATMTLYRSVFVAGMSLTGALMTNSSLSFFDNTGLSLTVAPNFVRSEMCFINNTLSSTTSFAIACSSGSVLSIGNNTFNGAVTVSGAFSQSSLLVWGNDMQRISLTSSFTTSVYEFTENRLVGTSYGFYVAGGHILTSSVIRILRNNITVTGTTPGIFFHPTTSLIKSGSVLFLQDNFIRGPCNGASANTIEISVSGGIVYIDGTNIVEGCAAISWAASTSGNVVWFANNPLMKYLTLTVTGTMSDSTIVVDRVGFYQYTSQWTVSVDLLRCNISILDSQLGPGFYASFGSITDSSVSLVRSSAISSSTWIASPTSNSKFLVDRCTFYGTFTMNSLIQSASYMLWQHSTFLATATLNNGFSAATIIMYNNTLDRLTVSGGTFANSDVTLLENRLLTSASYGIYFSAGHVTGTSTHRYISNNITLSTPGDAIFYHTTTSEMRGKLVMSGNFVRTPATTGVQCVIQMTVNGGVLEFDGSNVFEGNLNIAYSSAMIAGNKIHVANCTQLKSFTLGVTGTITDSTIMVQGCRFNALGPFTLTASGTTTRSVITITDSTFLLGFTATLAGFADSSFTIGRTAFSANLAITATAQVSSALAIYDVSVGTTTTLSIGLNAATLAVYRSTFTGTVSFSATWTNAAVLVAECSGSKFDFGNRHDNTSVEVRDGYVFGASYALYFNGGPYTSGTVHRIINMQVESTALTTYWNSVSFVAGSRLHVDGGVFKSIATKNAIDVTSAGGRVVINDQVRLLGGLAVAFTAAHTDSVVMLKNSSVLQAVAITTTGTATRFFLDVQSASLVGAFSLTFSTGCTACTISMRNIPATSSVSINTGTTLNSMLLFNGTTMAGSVSVSATLQNSSFTMYAVAFSHASQTYTLPCSANSQISVNQSTLTAMTMSGARTDCQIYVVGNTVNGLLSFGTGTATTSTVYVANNVINNPASYAVRFLTGTTMAASAEVHFISNTVTSGTQNGLWFDWTVSGIGAVVRINRNTFDVLAAKNSVLFGTISQANALVELAHNQFNLGLVTLGTSGTIVTVHVFGNAFNDNTRWSFTGTVIAGSQRLYGCNVYGGSNPYTITGNSFSSMACVSGSTYSRCAEDPAARIDTPPTAQCLATPIPYVRSYLFEYNTDLLPTVIFYPSFLTPVFTFPALWLSPPFVSRPPVLAPASYVVADAATLSLYPVVLSAVIVPPKVCAPLTIWFQRTYPPGTTPPRTATHVPTRSKTATDPTSSPSTTGSSTVTASASVTPSRGTASPRNSLSRSALVSRSLSPSISGATSSPSGLTHSFTSTGTSSATTSLTKPKSTPTRTIRLLRTATHPPTRTPGPTRTVSASITRKPVAKRTRTPSRTVTPSLTMKPVKKRTRTPTLTASQTASSSWSTSPSASVSATASSTLSWSSSPTPSTTHSTSPDGSASVKSASLSKSLLVTRSASTSPSITPPPTPTHSATLRPKSFTPQATRTSSHSLTLPLRVTTSPSITLTYTLSVPMSRTATLPVLQTECEANVTSVNALQFTATSSLRSGDVLRVSSKANLPRSALAAGDRTTVRISTKPPRGSNPATQIRAYVADSFVNRWVAASDSPDTAPSSSVCDRENDLESFQTYDAVVSGRAASASPNSMVGFDIEFSLLIDPCLLLDVDDLSTSQRATPPGFTVSVMWAPVTSPPGAAVPASVTQIPTTLSTAANATAAVCACASLITVAAQVEWYGTPSVARVSRPASPVVVVGSASSSSSPSDISARARLPTTSQVALRVEGKQLFSLPRRILVGPAIVARVEVQSAQAATIEASDVLDSTNLRPVGFLPDAVLANANVKRWLDSTWVRQSLLLTATSSSPSPTSASSRNEQLASNGDAIFAIFVLQSPARLRRLHQSCSLDATPGSATSSQRPVYLGDLYSEDIGLSPTTTIVDGYARCWVLHPDALLPLPRGVRSAAIGGQGTAASSPNGLFLRSPVMEALTGDVAATMAAGDAPAAAIFHRGARSSAASADSAFMGTFGFPADATSGAPQADFSSSLDFIGDNGLLLWVRSHGLTPTTSDDGTWLAKAIQNFVTGTAKMDDPATSLRVTTGSQPMSTQVAVTIRSVADATHSTSGGGSGGASLKCAVRRGGIDELMFGSRGNAQLTVDATPVAVAPSVDGRLVPFGSSLASSAAALDLVWLFRVPCSLQWTDPRGDVAAQSVSKAKVGAALKSGAEARVRVTTVSDTPALSLTLTPQAPGTWLQRWSPTSPASSSGMASVSTAAVLVSPRLAATTEVNVVNPESASNSSANLTANLAAVAAAGSKTGHTWLTVSVLLRPGPHHFAVQDLEMRIDPNAPGPDGEGAPLPITVSLIGSLSSPGCAVPPAATTSNLANNKPSSSSSSSDLLLLSELVCAHPGWLATTDLLRNQQLFSAWVAPPLPPSLLAAAASNGSLTTTTTMMPTNRTSVTSLPAATAAPSLISSLADTLYPTAAPSTNGATVAAATQKALATAPWKIVVRLDRPSYYKGTNIVRVRITARNAAPLLVDIPITVNATSLSASAVAEELASISSSSPQVTTSAPAADTATPAPTGLAALLPAASPERHTPSDVGAMVRNIFNPSASCLGFISFVPFLFLAFLLVALIRAMVAKFQLARLAAPLGVAPPPTIGTWVCHHHVYIGAFCPCHPYCGTSHVLLISVHVMFVGGFAALLFNEFDYASIASPLVGVLIIAFITAVFSCFVQLIFDRPYWFYKIARDQGIQPRKQYEPSDKTAVDAASRACQDLTDVGVRTVTHIGVSDTTLSSLDAVSIKPSIDTAAVTGGKLHASAAGAYDVRSRRVGVPSDDWDFDAWDIPGPALEASAGAAADSSHQGSETTRSDERPGVPNVRRYLGPTLLCERYQRLGHVVSVVGMLLFTVLFQVMTATWCLQDFALLGWAALATVVINGLVVQPCLVGLRLLFAWLTYDDEDDVEAIEGQTTEGKMEGRRRATWLDSLERHPVHGAPVAEP